MIIRGHSKIVYVIWVGLLAAALVAMVLGRWSMAFVAIATLLMSVAPALIADRFRVHVPLPFFTGMVLFIFGTLFLGEAINFYERYWWWDVLLHGASAVGFGLIGFVFVFSMFEGDRYAAPAWAIAFISLCFAMTIGAFWEMFEFTMDQLFGMTMQKSGLIDTMWDLIVDALGAAVGALAGFAFLRGRSQDGLPGVIGEFVRRNRSVYKKFKPKKR